MMKPPGCARIARKDGANGGACYEMTFAEQIEGPPGLINGFSVPPVLEDQFTEATLAGPRISASLVMSGTDRIRIEGDGIRR